MTASGEPGPLKDAPLFSLSICRSTPFTVILNWLTSTVVVIEASLGD